MILIERLRQAHNRRKAAQELRALPPHVLRDIGVEPGMIDEAVSGMLNARRAAEAKEPTAEPTPDLLLYKASVFSNAEWPYPKRRAA